jgi:hypothetical protein
MSNELYLILQSVILICYASWVAYRVGKSRGERNLMDIIEGNRKKQNTPFKLWKDIK